MILLDFGKYLLFSIRCGVSSLQYREGWIGLVALVLVKLLFDTSFESEVLGNLVACSIFFAFTTYQYKEEYRHTIRVRQAQKERKQMMEQNEEARRIEMQERRKQATLDLSKRIQDMKDLGDVSERYGRLDQWFENVHPKKSYMTNDEAYQMLRREKERFRRFGGEQTLLTVVGESEDDVANRGALEDVASQVQDVLRIASHTTLRWEEEGAEKTAFFEHLAQRGLKVSTEGNCLDEALYKEGLRRASKIPNVLRDLQKDEAIISKGHEGEQIVTDEIDKFGKSLKALYGNRFDAGSDGTVENDVLIFTDGGIFSLEVKNIKSGGNQSIRISKDGRWSQKSHENGTWRIDEQSGKIIDQVNRHIYLTEQFLLSHEPELKQTYTKEQLQVHPIIVIANNRVTIENETSWQIVRPNQIFSLVRGKHILSEAAQDELKALFEAHDLGQKPFAHTHYGQVGASIERDLKRLLHVLLVREQWNELYDLYVLSQESSEN